MMKLSTLKYLFKEGIVGLWRNRTMALASMGTIILCLLILGMSYGIGVNIDYLIEQVETKFGITAYLKENLNKQDIDKLQYDIKQIKSVEEVTYISKEQALKNFSEENEEQGLFEMFSEDNPLPASLEITVNDIAKQQEIVNQLKQMQGIDETIYFKDETASFMKIGNTIDYICLGILIILVVVGLMLMSNTIKLTVYVRRREINIMKYVGATNGFIQIPFLIEGMLIGLLGAMVSVAMITLSYDWVLKKFNEMTGVLSGFSLAPAKQIMETLVPMYIILGVGIGFIGSAFAIHKHLNV